MTGLGRADDSIWETWYDVLFNPSDAMKKVALAQQIRRALVSLLAGIIPFWAAYFAISGQISELSGAMIGLHVLTVLTIWVCASALLHMAAVLCGGRGEAAGILCTFGYVSLPQLFLLPIAAIAECLPAALRVFAIAAGLIVLTLWTVNLQVLALKGCYGFSIAKSLLVLLMPFLILLFGVALVILLLGASALTLVLS